MYHVKKKNGDIHTEFYKKKKRHQFFKTGNVLSNGDLPGLLALDAQQAKNEVS